MLDIRQFRDLVIVPALEIIELHSPAAEELVLGTHLQESKLRKLKQWPTGPAVGLPQMEPYTHTDLWTTYLNRKPDLARKARSLMLADSDEIGFAQQMAGNLYYAAAMCRIRYYRVPEALPEAGDIRAQAKYWKRYYNTRLGKGTVTEYIKCWKKYMT